MWALHAIDGWTPDALIGVLADHDEHVRAWAVQLLCERQSPPAAALARFAELATQDPSPVVRLYLAAALQRLDGAKRWPIARALMARAEDAADHNLPKLIWLGIEPLVSGDPAQALQHAGGSALSLVSRHIARRLVDADDDRTLDSLVAAIAARPAQESSLLEGLRDGLEGRVGLTAPPSWSGLRDRLLRGERGSAELARQVSQIFGDTDTARRNLETVRRRRAPRDERERALRALAQARRPELALELPALLGDASLRVDAIRALAAYDDDALGRLLIARYPSFSPGSAARRSRRSRPAPATGGCWSTRSSRAPFRARTSPSTPRGNSCASSVRGC